MLELELELVLENNKPCYAEANKVPDKKLSELDSITIICPRDANEV